MQLIEHEVTCPYCWEGIAIIVDTSIDEQEYVEDCSVCCRPILLHCVSQSQRVIDVQARAENE